METYTNLPGTVKRHLASGHLTLASSSYEFLSRVKLKVKSCNVTKNPIFIFIYDQILIPLIRMKYNLAIGNNNVIPTDN